MNNIQEPEEAETHILILKDAILHNFNEFKKLSKNVSPVLKSNAFGHGLVQVAKILKDETFHFLIVDSVEEAQIIKNEGIKKSILIIGYTPSLKVQHTPRNTISYTITSYEMLFDWSLKIKYKTKVHIKVDTGMNRQGISLHQISSAVEILKNSKNLVVEGVCSHFSDADSLDISTTEKQLKKWKKVVKIFKEEFSTLRYFHVSNTPGHAHLLGVESSFTRLGIGLYGLRGGGKIDTLVSLKPALQMRTIITGIKELSAGDKVGYSGTFIAKSKMSIATIPIGYGIGYDRRLSNKGAIKAGELFCPVIGRVSMNITTIDITKATELGLESEVVVISNKENDPNSIMNIAKKCKTNPHEIVTNINPLIKRRII
jgi:alanine racemase